MKKKRALYMTIIMSMALLLCSCGASENGAGSTKQDVEGYSSSDASDGESSETAGDSSDVYTDTAASEAGSEDVAYKKASDGEAAEEKVTLNNKADMAEAFEGEEETDIDTICPSDDEQERVEKVGLLTAGEWCDNENWGFYRNLFSNGSSYESYKDGWDMQMTNRIKVTVGHDGTPLPGAKVLLQDKEGKTLWQAVSDYKGVAYLFYNVNADTDVPVQVTIDVDGRKETKKLTQKKQEAAGDDAVDGQGRESEKGKNPQFEDVEYMNFGKLVKYAKDPDAWFTNAPLDLMFVVDTTGSMSDEITYLQMELKDVVGRVQQKHTKSSIKLSTNFYRDEGDEYVVNAHPFTDDIRKVTKWVNEEYANGGGDYPEAVHTALENAVDEHEWREESVKLLFLVLDAPPHSGDAVSESLYKSIKKMAAKGIRVIPVASSGVDKDTEFICRKFSVATGGTYTFLTDDSGIGGHHIEPTTGDYEVEKLNDLLVKIINRYLTAGK